MIRSDALCVIHLHDSAGVAEKCDEVERMKAATPHKVMANYFAVAPSLQASTIKNQQWGWLGLSTLHLGK